MGGFLKFLILIIIVGTGVYFVFTNNQFYSASVDKLKNISIVEEPTVPGHDSITIDLSEQNSSEERGKAVLIEQVGGVIVTLSMSGAPGGVPQPAHIHSGKCPDVGDVAYKLTDVFDGHSETVLGVSLKQLAGRLLAINVHKSVPETSNYVSCGDLAL